MGITTFILGEPGTGKSASMRNMPPEETLLIQCIKKPLPFRSATWKLFNRESCKTGNIFVTDDYQKIIELMQKTSRKRVVIDDYQYLMCNEFMRRTDERGFDKFSEIGHHAWKVIMDAADLPDDVRVYVLCHTDTSSDGMTKIKTIGKMLDEKVSLDGMVTICLRTKVMDGQFHFTTRNSGFDTVKSPMGLFDAAMIDNDLEAVDAAICNYYGIGQAAAA
jgi:hypothetical protein